MGILSAIPKAIVIALQIALAALLVLAVVPLAIGGLDVSDIESEPPEYEDGVITFNASATVNANLFFDITDFGYSVSIVSGDERISISEEPGITISKKGTTYVDIRMEIPLTTVMMLILLGAVTEDQETRMELTVHGSTMSGMISASATMDLLVPTVADVSGPGVILTTDEDDIMSIDFDMEADLLSDFLDMIPSWVKIEIGDTLIEFSKVADNKIEITWTSASGGLIESIEDAIAAAGVDGVKIHITDSEGTDVYIYLTKEQAQFILEILKIILGMIL
jgi:hypothetical protein